MNRDSGVTVAEYSARRYRRRYSSFIPVVLRSEQGSYPDKIDALPFSRFLQSSTNVPVIMYRNRLAEGLLLFVLGIGFVFYTVVVRGDPLSTEIVAERASYRPLVTPLGMTIGGILCSGLGYATILSHYREKWRWAAYEEERMDAE